MHSFTKLRILTLLLILLGVAAHGETAADGVPAVHIHDWTYTAEGATITAHCQGQGPCDVTEGLTLTLSAPNDLVYDGSGKSASIQYGYSTAAFGTEHPVTYAYGGETVTTAAPVDAETYTASVAPKPGMDGPCATVTFTIERSALEAALLPQAADSEYDGKPHPLVTAPETLPEGCEKLLYRVGDDQEWSDEVPTGTDAGEYTVAVKFQGDHNHTDLALDPILATIAQKPAGVVIATLTAQGDTSLKVTWKAAKYVDGYDVYLKRLGDLGKYQLVATVEDGTTQTTVTGLKRNACYKGGVIAWVTKGGEKQYVLDHSPVVYGITGGYARGVVNPGSLKLNRTVATVKMGRTALVNGSVKGVKNGRLLNRVSRLRFISSDPAVATVSKKGEISAVAPGSCEVYVFTNNGIWDTVKVTVDPMPDRVWFKKKTGTLRVGRSVDLGAHVRLWPSKSQTKLNWKSSNEAIATVTDQGVVKAVKKGECTITVTAENGVSARVKVKVRE